MNEALKLLYNEKFNEEFCNKAMLYNESLHSLKLTNPYLIVASDAYFNASKRVMVMGQETYGWLKGKEYKNGYFDKDNIPNRISKHYNEFVNNQLGYPSPIWNLYRNMVALGRLNNVGFISNNVGKVGYVTAEGNGIRDFDDQVNDSLTDIVIREIDICKPNVIICFCGNSRRYVDSLEKRIGKCCFSSFIEGVDVKKFAKLTNPMLDEKGIDCYLTYHPAYLQRNNKKEWCIKIYNEITNILRTM